MKSRSYLDRACKSKLRYVHSTAKKSPRVAKRMSPRLVMQSAETSKFCHFHDLPDEMILEIFHRVDEETLCQLRKTCVRFRDLILSATQKVDQTLMQVDPEIGGPRAAMQLILNCPRLKVLSLIDSTSSPSMTKAFLNSAINYSPLRNEIGDLLAMNCPNIQKIDLASIDALRLVRRYVERLNGSSQLTELRIFSSNVHTVVELMLIITRYAPRLTNFKLLRRTYQKQYAAVDHEQYNQLWSLMGQQLQNFSTNISDRYILSGCLIHMTNLRRIVIWHLNEDEVLTLVTHCKNLSTVILMNCCLRGFKYLVHLPYLRELTFHIKPYYPSCNLRDEFQRTFSEIGQRLTHLSLVMKDQVVGSLLRPIAKCCPNLKELKLREINQWDYEDLFTVMKELPALLSVHWSDNIALNPESTDMTAAEDILLKAISVQQIQVVRGKKLYKYSLCHKKRESVESSSSEDDGEVIPRGLTRRHQFTVKCTLVNSNYRGC